MGAGDQSPEQFPHLEDAAKAKGRYEHTDFCNSLGAFDFSYGACI